MKKFEIESKFETAIMLSGRLSDEQVPESISVLDSFSFDKAQKALLEDWIRRDINLVGPSA
jgi:hypothetical protein